MRVDVGALSNVRISGLLAYCVCGELVGKLCYNAKTVLLFNTHLRYDLVDVAETVEIRNVIDGVIRVS